MKVNLSVCLVTLQINSPIKNVDQRLRALLWMFATSLGVNDSVDEII